MENTQYMLFIGNIVEEYIIHLTQYSLLLFQMKQTKTITEQPLPWMEMQLWSVCIIHHTQSKPHFAQFIPRIDQMEAHERKNHPPINHLHTPHGTLLIIL